MKGKKLTFFVTSVIFIFASCRNSAEDIGREDTTAVKFTLSIDDYGQTRASNATWDAQDAIGVYMIKAGQAPATSTILADNKKFTTLGHGVFSHASAGDAIYFPEDGSQVDFIAYYPYQPVLNNYTYPVDLKDQSSQEAIDLMYAGNVKNASISNPAASLSFTHRLAKLALKVHPGTGTESLDGLQVSISGMNTEAAFDLTTGGLTVDTGSAAAIPMKISSGAGASAFAEAVILPVTNLQEGAITLTLPAATYTWKIPAGMTFDAGNRYTYEITLNDGGGSSVTPDYGEFESPAVTAIENTEYVMHSMSQIYSASGFSTRAEDRTQMRNYSMLYDTRYMLAYWVAYPLHECYLGDSGRTDKWAYDPYISKEYQPNLSKSYTDPNYDRGHQLPSADRTYSKAENYTTFYYSNMTAQHKYLNQRPWANLEKKIREGWMPECDTLYVVTGAMIVTADDQVVEYTKDRDGKNIALPKYHYKALAKKVGDDYYTIGFKMDNREYQASDSYDDYRITVSDLEKETGFIFFPRLPNSVKSTIEASRWK